MPKQATVATVHLPIDSFDQKDGARTKYKLTWKQHASIVRTMDIEVEAADLEAALAKADSDGVPDYEDTGWVEDAADVKYEGVEATED